MNKPKTESIVIIILSALVWVGTIYFSVSQSRRVTYRALDMQAQDCNNLRIIVEKTHTFAMTQPNNVRAIFRDIGYNVTMSPVPTSKDTTSEEAK